jgi:hypothetical protein
MNFRDNQSIETQTDHIYKDFAIRFPGIQLSLLACQDRLRKPPWRPRKAQ